MLSNPLRAPPTASAAASQLPDAMLALMAQRLSTLAAAVSRAIDQRVENSEQLVRLVESLCQVVRECPRVLLTRAFYLEESSGTLFCERKGKCIECKILPLIVMALLAVAEDAKKRPAELCLSALKSLHHLVTERLADSNDFVDILPGLTSRLYALRHQRLAVDGLFAAWRFASFRRELYAEHWERLLDLMTGNANEHVIHSLLSLQDDILAKKPSESSARHLARFLLANAGASVKEEIAVEYIDYVLQGDDSVGEDALLGAVQRLWPNEPLPQDLSWRLLQAKSQDDSKQLIVDKGSKLAEHISRVDPQFADAVVQRLWSGEPSKWLALIPDAIRGCSVPDRAIRGLLDFYETTAAGSASDSLGLSRVLLDAFAQLDPPRCPKSLPAVLVFLLSASHIDPLADASRASLDSLCKSQTLSDVILANAAGMHSVLTVQLDDPFVFPFAARCFASISRHLPTPTALAVSNRIAVSVLPEHYGCPAFAVELVRAVGECIEALLDRNIPLVELAHNDNEDCADESGGGKKREEVLGRRAEQRFDREHEMLLAMWPPLLPLTWSDSADIRHAALACVFALARHFPPNHAGILNLLHRSWPALVGTWRTISTQSAQSTILTQSTLLSSSGGNSGKRVTASSLAAPDPVNLMRVTLEYARMAPDFLAHRLASEWWPVARRFFLLSSAKNSREVAEVRRRMLPLLAELFWEGVAFGAEQIAQVFDVIGAEDELVLASLEGRWPDFVWYHRRRHRLQ